MLRNQIIAALKEATGSADVELFAPENPAHGHYSTNVAMKLAKTQKKNPLEVAQALNQQLTGNQQLFEKIEVASPGFINFWLAPQTLEEELRRIRNDERVKNPNLDGKKIMVEYTDPNPFKEFHIGHLYTNIIGETLARLLEAQGAVVRRANYQGDVGIHVAKAMWGLAKKMREENETVDSLGQKPLEERIRFMGQAYALGAAAFDDDAAAKEDITNLNKKIYDLDPDIRNLYEQGRQWSLDKFEEIYKRLGTQFDFYYFEREVGKVGWDLVKENLAKGIFEESDGAVIFPGERYGLHRRVFINSRGLPTYEAKDLGLAALKAQDFPYDLSIVVTANEINEYFKVILAALNQIRTDLASKIKHLGHGVVRFASGKMSSRTGNVVTAEGLLDDIKNRAQELMASLRNEFTTEEKENISETVTLAAVKYALLKSHLGQDIIFDYEKSLSLTGDSGPYLQYTYTRLRSVLEKAGAEASVIDLSLLEKDEEKNLARQLLYFPEEVARAADRLEPNIVADYLYKLANAANSFYEHAPILKAEGDLRQTRLALTQLAATVLKQGLYLLGIAAPEKM